MARLGLEPGMVGADESTELWRHPIKIHFIEFRNQLNRMLADLWYTFQDKEV